MGDRHTCITQLSGFEWQGRWTHSDELFIQRGVKPYRKTFTPDTVLNWSATNDRSPSSDNRMTQLYSPTLMQHQHMLITNHEISAIHHWVQFWQWSCASAVVELTHWHISVLIFTLLGMCVRIHTHTHTYVNRNLPKYTWPVPTLALCMLSWPIPRRCEEKNWSCGKLHQCNRQNYVW